MKNSSMLALFMSVLFGAGAMQQTPPQQEKTLADQIAAHFQRETMIIQQLESLTQRSKASTQQELTIQEHLQNIEDLRAWRALLLAERDREFDEIILRLQKQLTPSPESSSSPPKSPTPDVSSLNSALSRSRSGSLGRKLFLGLGRKSSDG